MWYRQNTIPHKCGTQLISTSTTKGGFDIESRHGREATANTYESLSVPEAAISSHRGRWNLRGLSTTMDGIGRLLASWHPNYFQFQSATIRMLCRHRQVI